MEGKLRFTGCGVILLCLMLGCGHDLGIPLERVRGTVLYNGKPLSGGTVVFHPLPPTPGPQALGQIGPDGTFEMSVLKHRGAAVGEHRVTIDYRRELTELEAQNLVIPDLLIPAIYARAATTPLKCTVKVDEENSFRFELMDK